MGLYGGAEEKVWVRKADTSFYSANL